MAVGVAPRGQHLAGVGRAGGACLGVGQGEGGHLGAHLDGLLLLLQAHLPLLLLLLQALDGQLPLHLQVLLQATAQWSGPLRTQGQRAGRPQGPGAAGGAAAPASFAA